MTFLREHAFAALTASLVVWLACPAASASEAPAPTDIAAETPAPSSVVAEIGGASIPYSQLQPKILDNLAALERDRDAQLREIAMSTARTRASYIRAAAGQMVDQRVLDLEAAAKRTTAKTLLDDLKIPKVTDVDMHAYYDGHENQIGAPYGQIEAKLREFLQKRVTTETQRQYLDGLRTKYHASVLVEPLREQVATTGPEQGPADAPVTIVEFSDFQCPYCGRLEPELVKLLKSYPDKVRLIYRNMPLPSLHPNAMIAAEAGVCARDQGKFWQMHDLMFAEQNALGAEALKEKAKRLGLDTKRFDQCLDGGSAMNAIKADETASRDLGLSATPSTFINGRFVNGAVSYEELDAIVRDELRRSALTAKR